MTTVADIRRLRMRRQLIGRGTGRASKTTPAKVVARLCAVQAQDYPGALWSLALRSGPDTSRADVERAVAQRRIVRTWPMRGTLHFVAPADVRWMLRLLTPRVIARMTARHRQLGLTDDDFERARELLTQALAGGNALTRQEALAVLDRAGISSEGQRGYHVLGVLAQRAVICLGPMHGKQQTFVLLDEWVPPSGEAEPRLDEALARLAARYFEGHGPATLADFAWWAGITKAQARTGLDAASGGLKSLTVEGAEYWLPARMRRVPANAPDPDIPAAHLLPGFDEYQLGYTDRTLQLGEYADTYRVGANGMFEPTLLIDGIVTGTWKRTMGRGEVLVAVSPFRRLGREEREALAEAADRFGRFLELPVKLEA